MAQRCSWQRPKQRDDLFGLGKQVTTKTCKLINVRGQVQTISQYLLDLGSIDQKGLFTWVLETAGRIAVLLLIPVSDIMDASIHKILKEADGLQGLTFTFGRNNKVSQGFRDIHVQSLLRVCRLRSSFILMQDRGNHEILFDHLFNRREMLGDLTNQDRECFLQITKNFSGSFPRQEWLFIKQIARDDPEPVSVLQQRVPQQGKRSFSERIYIEDQENSYLYF